MHEVAMLCWDRPNANSFNVVEQVGGADAAQVYFQLMQGKRLSTDDVSPLIFSAEEIEGGVWPDFADLSAGLALYSPELVNLLRESCDAPDDVYQFFEPRWMDKPAGLPDYKICNLLDLRRDALIEEKVVLTPDDPEVSQGRVAFVDKLQVEGCTQLVRLKASRVIAVQPLLEKLLAMNPKGMWFRNRVRWTQ